MVIKDIKKKKLLEAITSLVLLAIIILGVSAFFMNNEYLIGPAFIFLGLINFIFLKIYKVKLKSIYPDIVFGVVDNSVLVSAAVLGGSVAGVVGAIIGGAAGNAITDGIGGLFEGYVAQGEKENKLSNNRNPLSTMLGKMMGSLFGAGIGLIMIWAIKLVF